MRAKRPKAPYPLERGRIYRNAGQYLINHEADDVLNQFTATKQAEDMLYNIHLSVLKALSPVFKEIFEIPPLASQNAEGTIQNPMKMPQVTAVEMTDFLNWIYKM